MKKLIFSVIAAAFSFCTTAQTLVFHTSFDNGLAADLSGNGFNGTVNGATAAAGFTGTANTALKFDGVNDNVTIAANAAFNLTTWTLQAMVRFDGFYAGTCQASSMIWHGTQFSTNCYALFTCDNFYDGSCTVNTPTQEAFAAFAAGSSAVPDFQTTWYTTNGFVQAGAPATTRWYCVTATYDGTTMRIYVDGTLIESGTWGGGAYSYGAGTAITYIGSSNTPAGSYPYWLNATLDQVSIWSGAMAATTIDGFCDKTEINSWRQSNPKTEEEAIKSVNIMEIANDKIEIFPNPASTEITVNMSQHWKGGKMVIMNGVGQVVMEQTVEGTQHSIDISNLPMGIYMLKTMKGNEMKVEKFIKNL